jgi:hypothetical protein
MFSVFFGIVCILVYVSDNMQRTERWGPNINMLYKNSYQHINI